MALKSEYVCICYCLVVLCWVTGWTFIFVLLDKQGSDKCQEVIFAHAINSRGAFSLHRACVTDEKVHHFQSSQKALIPTSCLWIT